MRTDDAGVRERVRLNVGHSLLRQHHHPPAALSPRVYVSPTRAGRAPAAPPASPTDVPLLPQGAALGVDNPGRPVFITLGAPTGVRTIHVSNRLAFPYLIRKINVMGTAALTEAISFRLLVSADNDTTATADPTGTDIVTYSGDVVGAEDPGLHAALSTGPLVLEPWLYVAGGGTYLKVKVHNVVGATRLLAVAVDLDEIPL